MKIAVTARFLGGRLEGLGHYTKELLSHLVATHTKDEWHVIYDQDKDRCLIKGGNVFNHFIGPKTRHPLLISFWTAYRLPGLLDKIKPDLVWYPDGIMSMTSSYPSLLTIHDLAYLSYPQGSRGRDLRFYKKYIPRYLEKASGIITISNYTSKVLIEKFPSTKEKTKVIYNGSSCNYKVLSTNEQAAFRMKYTNEQPFFLHLGAIHPRKNVESLICAFEVFKQSDSNYKLVLAGRMAWKSLDVKRLIAESAYKEDIIHLEDIDDIIYDLVGSASALCSLSLVEGFGLPVLEAMACGVPVIVSEDSAMSEVAGPAAFTCSPREIKKIASTMKQVINKPALTKEKVNLGLERAKQFYWKRASSEVYAEMTNIVQDGVM